MKLEKQSLKRTLRHYRIRITAVVLLIIAVLTNFGARLGIWSSPDKKGLLPYEAPNLQAFEDLLINDAFAS